MYSTGLTKVMQPLVFNLFNYFDSFTFYKSYFTNAEMGQQTGREGEKN